MHGIGNPSNPSDTSNLESQNIMHLTYSASTEACYIFVAMVHKQQTHAG